ncbi:MAG TPA: hypothetical protein VNT26_04480 [Candidatus Sulfotelmatobacter sp.]|nr:hypothetical protein [Candidatus Sulfotelmatobacter sp.]
MNSTICIPHSALPTPHSELNPRRKGKIARLPKPTRDLINHMLDDNLPYHVIIDEPGEGLNAQNLTNWVQGGYQDYLKHQAALDRVRAEMEFATDLLKETDNAAPTLLHRATNLIAATQLFDAVRQYGDEALKNLLLGNPAKYLTMLNTIATMANAGIKLEKQRLSPEAHATLPVSSQIKPDQGSAAVVAVRFQPPVPAPERPN